MRIEILYGELANLLGEHGTQSLLAQTFGEDKLIRTHFPELPQFLVEDVDFVYMGPMTEQTQRLVLDLWRDKKDLFAKAITRDTVFFFAGNALDLVGRSIRYEERETVEALGLYPFDTLCRRYDRQNEIVCATFNEMPLTGFRSQFTTHTGDAGAFPFLVVEQGSGMNKDIQTEGIHDRNFFATSLLGPFLILNPSFTKWLLARIGFHGTLPHEAALVDAERIRLEDLALTFDRKRKLGAFYKAYKDKQEEILSATPSTGAPNRKKNRKKLG
ncbi:MAG TPA: hypothetical protein VFD19_00655 [Clostridia bacterium]|nr:hypothetical protein [Clostridia bacterium]